MLDDSYDASPKSHERSAGSGWKQRILNAPIPLKLLLGSGHAVYAAGKRFYTHCLLAQKCAGSRHSWRGIISKGRACPGAAASGRRASRWKKEGPGVTIS